MKHYFNEVKKLDSNKIKVIDFIKKVMGDITIDEFVIAGVYRIYKEDGGKMSKDEFFEKSNIPVKNDLNKEIIDDFISGKNEN